MQLVSWDSSNIRRDTNTQLSWSLGARKMGRDGGGGGNGLLGGSGPPSRALLAWESSSDTSSASDVRRHQSV